MIKLKYLINKKRALGKFLKPSAGRTTSSSLRSLTRQASVSPNSFHGYGLFEVDHFAGFHKISCFNAVVVNATCQIIPIEGVCMLSLIQFH